MDYSIGYTPEVWSNIEEASRLEWLETNGIGGFASSTIIGMNTRRYHGLLTAATTPPLGRVVLLSKLEETLIVGGVRYDLGVNRYPGVIHPNGYQHLREFRLYPCPTFIYEADGVRLEKRVYMVQGENTTVVDYHLSGNAVLEIRPLIAFRDYHATTHENGALNPRYETLPGAVKLTPYQGMTPMYLRHADAAIGPGDGWYRNFEFDRERERGLDFSEDLFNPLVLRFAGSVRLSASTEPLTAPPPDPPNTEPPQSLREALVRAADQFLVKRGDGMTVIAGYHWFSDWGRDTMIALPGLTLATGRHEVARQILEEFASVMSEGMLPNRFPDAGQTPEYNTVDATLWFFEAARAYAAATNDYCFLKNTLYPKLKESIDWHLRGTRYGIRVDADSLLTCGEPGCQLTWMDSKIGDWVVTPRHGKPVEIQALWYNALRIMEDLARRFDDESYMAFTAELAEQARDSFNRQFWNADAGCLYDVVNGNQSDPSIRPNQVFALSLTHSMVCADRARKVLDVVDRELLTPMGLRSLSPRDPHYRGIYEGGVTSRDSAYHQGTVWPYLIGPYVDAVRRFRGKANLESFPTALSNYGLGQLPEIADGDAPHTPRGCIAQAWSVAELLRVLHNNEESEGTRQPEPEGPVHPSW